MTKKSNSKYREATERLVVYVDRETLGILNEASISLLQSRSKIVQDTLKAAQPVLVRLASMSQQMREWSETANAYSEVTSQDIDNLFGDFKEYVAWRRSLEIPPTSNTGVSPS